MISLRLFGFFWWVFYTTTEPTFKVQHTDRHLAEKEELSRGTLSIFYNYNYLIWCKAFSHTFIKAVFTLWFFFSNIFSACKFIIERWHVDGISTKIEHLSQNLRDSSKISETRGSQHSFTSKIRCHFADTRQNCKYSGVLENYKLNSFISDSFFKSRTFQHCWKTWEWRGFEANPTFPKLDGGPTCRIAYYRYEN